MEQKSPILIEPERWRRLTAAVDLIALLTALAVALASGGHTSPKDVLFAGVYAGFAVAMTRGAQLLHQSLLPSAFATCLSALRACSVAVMLATATAWLLGFGRPASLGVWLWIATVATMCVTRVVLTLFGRWARRHGALTTRTLVVGAGLVGARIARRLLEKPEYGMRPVGFLDAEPMPGAVDSPVPVLGSPEDLASVAARTGATNVILAFSTERDHRMVALVRRCRELGLDIAVVPRLYESVNERAQLDYIGGLPVLSLQNIDPKGWQFALKHVLDRVGALAFVMVLSPLLIVIAAAVKLSSPGPVIFRQRRVGRDGRVFDVLKFRTMTQAPKPMAFVLKSGSAPGGVEGIDRRTRVGRWLRSTSLDELPQLFNVLRGEMSLVGPRPERPEFAEQFAREVHGYKHRHRVKSGITGWAQVNGLRGQTSIADRVEWDNHYIENWSLELELRTIALTLAEVLRFREDPKPQLPPGATAEVAAHESHAQTAADAVISEVAVTGSAEPVVAVASADTVLTDEQPDLIVAPALTYGRPVDNDDGPQVVAEDDEGAAAVWFCGYCGESPPAGTTPAPVARVCGACGQGLMLEVRADAAPKAGEAFVVVDSRLTVQALSRQAEEVLGVREEEATDRPIAELLVDADAESEDLMALLNRANTIDGQPHSTFVRPKDTYGVRVRARITACGPPRAALIVFETTPETPNRRSHLRLVSAPQQAANEA